MSVEASDLLKLLFALLAGGLIGAEREFRDKAAGFRTLILICTGAALFTMLSARFAVTGDPGRIAAGVVTGIGFLGAGTILRDRGRIMGLTTAALIWMTAAIGVAIGGGQVVLAFVALLIVLAVIWIFPFVERRIDLVRESRAFEIVLPLRTDKIEEIAVNLASAGLKVSRRKIVKGKDHLLVHYELYGQDENFARFTSLLIADQDVQEFRC
jgi:putative Mg2+ transporter-C (MgtC) family protein